MPSMRVRPLATPQTKKGLCGAGTLHRPLWEKTVTLRTFPLHYRHQPVPECKTSILGERNTNSNGQIHAVLSRDTVCQVEILIIIIPDRPRRPEGGQLTTAL